MFRSIRRQFILASHAAQVSRNVACECPPVLVTIITEAIQHTRGDVVLRVRDIECIGGSQESVGMLEMLDIYRLRLFREVKCRERAQDMFLIINNIGGVAVYGDIRAGRGDTLDDISVLQDHYLWFTLRVVALAAYP